MWHTNHGVLFLNHLCPHGLLELIVSRARQQVLLGITVVCRWTIKTNITINILYCCTVGQGVESISCVLLGSAIQKNGDISSPRLNLELRSIFSHLSGDLVHNLRAIFRSHHTLAGRTAGGACEGDGVIFAV